MNHICTWFCADEKGEESIFPQTGQKSSSPSHQNIYWKCILVFFITSKRFNKSEKHLLFTNVSSIPTIDGINVKKVLEELGVTIIHTSFKYKTPKGYYGSFQNQFYEFSILEHIADTDSNLNNQYLVLDSDCIFLKSATALFQEAQPKGFISFTDPVTPDYVINGLSRQDMKNLFEELLERKLDTAPEYHLGEFLLCSTGNIKKINADFQVLWPEMLKRFETGKPRFNEEAHTLSFLYYKNGLQESKATHFMRRIWTNPLFYRDVKASDKDLIIWHLPAEKTFGIAKLYDLFFHQLRNYGFDISSSLYQETVETMMGIPNLTLSLRTKYYLTSIYRKVKKTLKQAS